MIITIDTSKDSPDDIRRAISLLQQIAHGSSNASHQSYGHTPPVNSAFDFSTPSSSSSNSMSQPANTLSPADGFAAMFGDMGTTNQAPVTSSLSNQPLSNVAATSQPISKKKEKYDFETY